jgi:hypothetical protein
MSTKIMDCIASIPRDYLMFRSKNIIKTTDALHLKSAIDTQKRFRNLNDKYDLSMIGEPQEICVYAESLCRAGVFAFLSTPYRKAKKLFTIISRRQIKFDACKASRTLKEIADAKDEWQRLERNAQLKELCSPFFNGINTDFKAA